MSQSEEIDFHARLEALVRMVQELQGLPDDQDVLTERIRTQVAIPLTFQLNYFQEQPQLLDQKLEELITPLVRRISESILNRSELVVLRFFFRVLYTITKVRRFKAVGKPDR